MTTETKSIGRPRATSAEVRFSVRLRAPATDWLYELRLRMGQDGKLAETAAVVRMALERLNASPDCISCQLAVTGTKE